MIRGIAETVSGQLPATFAEGLLDLPCSRREARGDNCMVVDGSDASDWPNLPLLSWSFRVRAALQGCQRRSSPGANK